MEEREDTKPGEKEKVIPPKVIRPQIGLALSAEKAGNFPLHSMPWNL